MSILGILGGRLLFAGQLTFESGKCTHTPVPKYISKTHLYDFVGEFPTAKEIEEANLAAVRALIHPKCAALTEEQCLNLQKETMVVDYQISHENKQICSLVMVSAEASNASKTSKNAVELLISNLNNFVKSSIENIDTDKIWIQSPTIVGTGCSAGPIGLEIQMLLKKALLEKEIEVNLRGDLNTPSIGIQLRVGQKTQADIFFNKDGATTLLATIDIPESLTPPAARSCIAAQDLGLSNLKSFSGIELMIDLPKNVFCEGEQIQPVIKSNIPAKVILLSLTNKDLAYFVWPTVGVPNLIESELPIDFTAIPSYSGSEERLLAFAIPHNSNFGSLEDTTSVCSLNNWQNLIPLESSITTVSYQILPSGVGGCPYENSDPKQAYIMERTMKRIKPCR